MFFVFDVYMMFFVFDVYEGSYNVNANTALR
jgi:hypothetical protein